MQEYWFKRKQYGWGWYPATREGWLVTAMYCALVLVLAFHLDDTMSAKDVMKEYLAPVAILTLIFISIAWRTGEKPKWQWGEGTEKTDE